MPKRKLGKTAGEQAHPRKRSRKPKNATETATEITTESPEENATQNDQNAKDVSNDLAQGIPELPTMQPVHVASFNDALGANVSTSIRQKIISGEYIDLSILLSTNLDQDQEQKLLILANGQLSFAPKSNKSKITDIKSWTDAFLIFASIYLEVHKNETSSILKYMHAIRLGASRTSGLGWRTYDEQFRLKKARYQTISWATVDAELWLLFMYKASGYEGGSTSSPLVANKNAVGKCFDYNYKGFCLRLPCGYKHLCLKCNGNHPIIGCYQNAPYIQSLQQTETSRFRPPFHSNSIRSARFETPRNFLQHNQTRPIRFRQRGSSNTETQFPRTMGPRQFSY